MECALPNPAALADDDTPPLPMGFNNSDDTPRIPLPDGPFNEPAFEELPGGLKSAERRGVPASSSLEFRPLRENAEP